MMARNHPRNSDGDDIFKLVFDLSTKVGRRRSRSTITPFISNRVLMPDKRSALPDGGAAIKEAIDTVMKLVWPPLWLHGPT
jgi:hypothetical protein